MPKYSATWSPSPFRGSSSAATTTGTATAAALGPLAPSALGPEGGPGPGPGVAFHQYPWLSVEVEHLPTHVKCTPMPGAVASYTGTCWYLPRQMTEGAARESVRSGARERYAELWCGADAGCTGGWAGATLHVEDAGHVASRDGARVMRVIGP